MSLNCLLEPWSKRQLKASLIPHRIPSPHICPTVSSTHHPQLYIFPPEPLHTFLDLHNFAGVELHLQTPISLVLVQPAVCREGVLFALTGHTNLNTAQEPACMQARAVMPDHQPVDLEWKRYECDQEAVHRNFQASVLISLGIGTNSTN